MKKSPYLVALLAIGLFGLQACVPWGRRPDGGAELAIAVDELAQMVARLEGEEEIAVLGFRDAAGAQTTATGILDEYLISALLRAGVPLVLADGAEGGKWDSGETIPVRQWEKLSSPRVLGGRLYGEDPWVYLRLVLIERESETVLKTGVRRLASAALREQVEQRTQREETAAGPVLISAELHLLGLRSEGGFDQPVEIEEDGVLRAGDRLQIRFKVDVDCQVNAFLYSSEGQVIEVLGSRLVYGGRLQYGPGEEAWVAVGEPDKVYTLYFIAAPRLDEDRSVLFEKMARLIDQGKVERFRGLEEQDRALAAFLQAGLEDSPPIEVVRGVGEDELGEKQNFILPDGTLVESWAEKLGPAFTVVRGLSFTVQ